MAIIVTHKEKGGRFAVVGGGLAKWESAHGHWLFGDGLPVVNKGQARVLVVCGADGMLQFADADAMRVVSIDGQAPQELLGSAANG